MTNMMDDSISVEAAPDPDAGQKKNLWQKLAEVRQLIGYIERRGRHPTKHFSFIPITDIRHALSEELAIRNITFGPSARPSKQRDTVQKTKSGDRSMIETEVLTSFEFINGDNPDERYALDWVGWTEGSDAFAAAGAMTNAQRTFLESFFMMISGDVTKKQWTADNEAELAKQREKGTRRVVEEKGFKAKMVSGPGKTPTKEELEDSNQTEPYVQEEAPDESWRGIGLTMSKGLSERYPGKTVGDITLNHLISAQQFVSMVNGHKEGYRAPGHHQLANALVGRLIWEKEQGNILEHVNSAGQYEWEIVSKNVPKNS